MQNRQERCDIMGGMRSLFNRPGTAETINSYEALERDGYEISLWNHWSKVCQGGAPSIC
jgi:hypothetical protein